MIKTIDSLQTGTTKQKKAYRVIRHLQIFEHLADYHPILCGTLPIELDIPGSDLDIIMETYDLRLFEKRIANLYRHQESFTIKKRLIREQPVVIANFIFDGFEFELFGQPQPVKQQYAYLHMVIEHALISQDPMLKKEVLDLKKQGLKTEPAFCKVLGLEEDDPYESLLEYGQRNGLVEGGTEE